MPSLSPCHPSTASLTLGNAKLQLQYVNTNKTPCFKFILGLLQVTAPSCLQTRHVKPRLRSAGPACPHRGQAGAALRQPPPRASRGNQGGWGHNPYWFSLFPSPSGNFPCRRDCMACTQNTAGSSREAIWPSHVKLAVQKENQLGTKLGTPTWSQLPDL